jgi:hypothetical protein
MTKPVAPAPRRPWISPRIVTLSTGQAEAGFVAVNPEGLAKGS